MDRPVYFKDLALLGAAVFIFKAVFLVADELTITTYYPSPYGVYNQLRTRGDTFLGTQAGSQVGVGSSAVLAGGAKLVVNGEAWVGDGGTGPLRLGDTATVHSAPGVAITASGSSLHLESSQKAVTFGRAALTQTVTINGNLRINPPNCAQIDIPFGAGVTALCAATEYATWIPGLYVEGRMDQPNPFLRDTATNQEYEDFTLTADPNGGTPPGSGVYTFASGSGNVWCCPKTP